MSRTCNTSRSEVSEDVDHAGSLDESFSVKGAKKMKKFAKKCLTSLTQRPENIVMVLLGTLMSIAILGPLIIIVFKSFHVQESLFTSVASLDNYIRFTIPRNITAIKNSFIIAGGAALLGGVMGITLAWITARTNMPFKTVFKTLNMVPFFISCLVGAISWSLLASPQVGMLNSIMTSIFGLEKPLLNIYSIPGIIWVSALFHTPFIYLFCIGPFSQMDPALEEAARVSGSSWLSTTLRITLPMASPAIISALILTFVLCIEDLGAPLVLGYPYGIQTISTIMFDGIDQYPPDHNFSAAMGVLLMCITIFGVLMQRRIMKSKAYTSVTGRGYKPPTLDLGWGRYVALAINLFYLTFAVFLPIATLVVVSLSKAWLGNINVSEFTMHWYQFIFTQNDLTLRGIKNSLILSFAGATIGIAIATVIGYAIHRIRGRFGAYLDFVTTLPIAVSGMVMAIGFLVALIKTPVYGTIWIILIAYVVRFFTYGQRSISSIIVSLSKDLEESSRVCGASWFKTTWKILVPLIWSGFVGGWLLLFITYMREVSMSLMLSRKGTETLSVALYELLNYAPYGAMAAFTIVQVCVVFLAAIIFMHITKGRGLTI